MRKIGLVATLLLLYCSAALTAATRYQARELMPLFPGAYSEVQCVAGDGTAAGQSDNRAVVWRPDGSTRILDDGYWASGINNDGCIAGMLSPPQAAFWDADGLLHPIGTLPGFTESIAFDVSDSGKVVGYSRGPQVDVNSAFVWTSESGLTPLPNLNGYDHSIAFGVNAGGWVAGVSSQGLGHATDRPTLWDADGHPTDLGTPAGYLGGNAQGHQ